MSRLFADIQTLTSLICHPSTPKTRSIWTLWRAHALAGAEPERDELRKKEKKDVLSAFYVS